MPEPPDNSVHPGSRAAWRAWLEAHHAHSEGVWLVLNKKASGQPCLSRDDVVEEAIAFGWIDSVQKPLDEHRSMQWVSPRKRGSGWSRLSKERAERMAESGRLTEAGHAVIEAAQDDGSWALFDDAEALVVPDDLTDAFDARPPARDHWDAFPPSTRRAILQWILLAKRAPTRAKRIEETARLAQKNERANQWPRSK